MSGPARGAARLDLRALEIPSGGSAHVDALVTVDDLRLGGQRYRVAPRALPLRVEVTRSLTGVHLRLRAETRLEGPCWRCAEEARVVVAIDAQEYSADGRDAGAPFDDDLDSVYVEDGRVDLAQWARDALVEAMPATILCRESCAGLCAECGHDLNAGPCGCVAQAGDPRWQALAALAERLGGRPEG
jgi:uncharacterized protein